MRTIYRKPVQMEQPELILERPCRYVAGDDIVGRLAAGPLETDLIGIPASPNGKTRERIRLIEVGDLEVQQKYTVKSYIGVRKDGTLLPNVILRSDLPGAPRYASANARIRFTPGDCRYARKMVKTQGFVADPAIPPSERPIIYAGPDPTGLRFARGRTANGTAAAGRVIPARPGTYRLYGLRIHIIRLSGPRITYSITNPLA